MSEVRGEVSVSKPYPLREAIPVDRARVAFDWIPSEPVLTLELYRR